MVSIKGEDVLVDSLDHGELLFTLDVEVDQSVSAVVTQHGVEFEQIQVDVDGLFQDLAVNNSRHAEVLTETT